ncbi:unnamed protein product [Paramecium octaurelia]|uniref:Uncharacterized protein n=1 Tax=Paramecium octaurelia TaxID=43137 RepID=A0A8S1XXC8_PAROT|nr:unnamed protein product [Paramecium octaurelia]
MPPKNKKEEEAARLAEEERKRQLEEQLRQEEERKYGCGRYRTNMGLPISQYIINEVFHLEDASILIKEYLCKILERNHCEKLRDIDIEIAGEQLINDFSACQDFGFNGDQALIFINMMFLVYINQHEKFGKLVEGGLTRGKSLQGDRKLFQQLLSQHSTDGQGCHKVFVAKQLQPIIDYIEKGYLSHWLLLHQAHSHNQRPLEIQVDLQIELPLPQPSLEDHTYYKPIVTDDTQSFKKTEMEEQEVEYHEPTDEELLDSVIMNAIQDKLSLAQQELETRLKDRQVEIESKLQEMAAALTKKKK